MDLSDLDARPVIVALGGPNGAGKTTFFRAFLQPAALRFVNADRLARELGLGPYEGAALADQIRRALLAQGESFVFETVLSDPVGAKIDFLEEAARAGYSVLLCFIGLESASVSEDRVAMRASQGGHDVPTRKLRSRFPRTLRNLARAVSRLPRVLVYDNTDLERPFRLVAVFEDGVLLRAVPPVPAWLEPILAGEGPQGG